MQASTRKTLLRANAVFLVVAAAAAFANDVRGAYFGEGPVGTLLASAPHTAIGFIEAHGLAFILGILLWRATPTRAWHLTATAVHVLLGLSNLAFWDGFGAADMMAVGYVTTILHCTFALLQFAASTVAPAEANRVRALDRAPSNWLATGYAK